MPHSPYFVLRIRSTCGRSIEYSVLTMYSVVEYRYPGYYSTSKKSLLKINCHHHQPHGTPSILLRPQDLAFKDDLQVNRWWKNGESLTGYQPWIVVKLKYIHAFSLLYGVYPVFILNVYYGILNRAHRLYIASGTVLISTDPPIRPGTDPCPEYGIHSSSTLCRDN